MRSGTCEWKAGRRVVDFTLERGNLKAAAKIDERVIYRHDRPRAHRSLQKSLNAIEAALMDALSQPDLSEHQGDAGKSLDQASAAISHFASTDFQTVRYFP